jgi:hypothetical protein
MSNNVSNYVVTATGTTPELTGETKLGFDSGRSTLYQNEANLPANSTGGFVSNIETTGMLIDSIYPADPSYTGETIKALAKGPNLGAGAIVRGQLCYWLYSAGQFSFDVVNGGGVGGNAHMLAIALQDISSGSEGTFLLKGFVSVFNTSNSGYLDLVAPITNGEPLYIDRATSGYYCNAAGWSGTPGTDLYRCIGYLLTTTAETGGSYHVIRFDPSTDYIV